MKTKKKTIGILVTVIVLTLLLTVTASATKPEHVTGYVPLSSYMPGPEFEEYDICDPYFVGHAVQPAAPPGKAIPVIATAGPIDDPNCTYSADFEGVEATCKLMLLPVEEFGNPDSKEGKATILQCTGDLAGLHANFRIHFDFTYDAWYHSHP